MNRQKLFHLSKVSYLVLIMVMISTLIACNGGQEEAESTPEQETAQTTNQEPAEKAATETGGTIEATDEGDIQVVEIEAVGNQMEFNKDTIQVKAGKPVKLVLVNNADIEVMRHNIVFTQQGTYKEVGQAATEKSAGDMKADSAAYVPEMDEVLAASKVADAGETISFTFDPPEAGTYDFVCTFPGHYMSMNGIFIVKP